MHATRDVNVLLLEVSNLHFVSSILHFVGSILPRILLVVGSILIRILLLKVGNLPCEKGKKLFF